MILTWEGAVASVLLTLHSQILILGLAHGGKLHRSVELMRAWKNESQWKGNIRIVINSTWVSCKTYTLVNKGNPSAFPSTIKTQPTHSLKEKKSKCKIFLLRNLTNQIILIKLPLKDWNVALVSKRSLEANFPV